MQTGADEQGSTELPGMYMNAQTAGWEVYSPQAEISTRGLWCISLCPREVQVAKSAKFWSADSRTPCIPGPKGKKTQTSLSYHFTEALRLRRDGVGITYSNKSLWLNETI